APVIAPGDRVAPESSVVAAATSIVPWYSWPPVVVMTVPGATALPRVVVSRSGWFSSTLSDASVSDGEIVTPEPCRISAEPARAGALAALVISTLPPSERRAYFSGTPNGPNWVRVTRSGSARAGSWRWVKSAIVVPVAGTRV